MTSSKKRGAVSRFLFLGTSALLFCSAYGHPHSFGFAYTDTPKSNEYYGPVVGIDIGSVKSSIAWLVKHGNHKKEVTDRVQQTNCRVAYSNTILPNHVTEIRSMPACVAFTRNGVLVGNDTLENDPGDSQNLICGVKELLGRNWSDPDLRAIIEDLRYRVVEKNGEPMIAIDTDHNERFISPEEIYTILFGRLKEIAEDFLQDNVTHAVATVPASYNDKQRRAVRDSGVRAGLNILLVMNEPTAASIAYGLDESTRDEVLVLVYDISATKIDVTISELDGGMFDILGTASAKIGGKQFTEGTVNHYMKNIERRSHPPLLSRLVAAAEHAKRELSSNMSSAVDLPDTIDGYGLHHTLTREEFEQVNDDLFSKALGPVSQLLHELNLTSSQIDEIVLVGGSGHIPKIQRNLEEYFGKNISRGPNADDAVVIGSSRQGASLSGEEAGDVGCGFFELTPLSAGIETAGGTYRKLVLRNTIIPTHKTAVFTTNEDNQTKMLIRVFEGERASANDNELLGEFEVSGILPAPKGSATVEVSFEFDANGILRVTATDKGSGLSTKLYINDTAFNARSDYTWIEKIVMDAEHAFEEDQVWLKAQNATIVSQNAIASPPYIPGDGVPARDEL